MTECEKLARQQYQADRLTYERHGISEAQFVESQLVSAGLATLEIGSAAGETPAEADPAAWMHSDLEGRSKDALVDSRRYDTIR